MEQQQNNKTKGIIDAIIDNGVKVLETGLSLLDEEKENGMTQGTSKMHAINAGLKEREVNIQQQHILLNEKQVVDENHDFKIQDNMDEYTLDLDNNLASPLEGISINDSNQTVLGPLTQVNNNNINQNEIPLYINKQFFLDENDGADVLELLNKTTVEQEESISDFNNDNKNNKELNEEQDIIKLLNATNFNEYMEGNNELKQKQKQEKMIAINRLVMLKQQLK